MMMQYLKVPWKLAELHEVKAMSFKAEEPTHVAIGRLMLFLSNTTATSRKNFSHDEIDEFVGWDRADLRFSEVLEYAGFGTIQNKEIVVSYPKGFTENLRFVEAGKARAKNAARDERGRMISKKLGVTSVAGKPSPARIHKETSRNEVTSPKKEALNEALPASDQNKSDASTWPVAGNSERSAPSLPPLVPLPFPPVPLSQPPIIPLPSPFPDTQKFALSGPEDSGLKTRGDKKAASEKAIAERRELNEFWRSSYFAKFGHEYPRPSDARYNAEVAKIHKSLGLKLAKAQLTTYLAWNDSRIVKEGHPIEYFLTSLVKMESDRKRWQKKLVTSGQTKALKESFEKGAMKKSEVDLAYENIKREQRAERESTSSGLQKVGPQVPAIPQLGVRSESIDRFVQSEREPRGSVGDVRHSGTGPQPVPQRQGVPRDNQPVQASFEIPDLPAGSGDGRAWKGR